MLACGQAGVSLRSFATNCAGLTLLMCRHAGPAVGYICDVAFPTPLYGPIVGVLLRVVLPF